MCNDSDIPDHHDVDEYELWGECNRCSSCDGVGEDFFDDEWNDQTMDYGKPWVCPRCGGSGIEPRDDSHNDE